MQIFRAHFIGQTVHLIRLSNLGKVKLGMVRLGKVRLGYVR
jgi:hypothetical protein